MYFFQSSEVASHISQLEPIAANFVGIVPREFTKVLQTSDNVPVMGGNHVSYKSAREACRCRSGMAL